MISVKIASSCHKKIMTLSDFLKQFHILIMMKCRINLDAGNSLAGEHLDNLIIFFGIFASERFRMGQDRYAADTPDEFQG